MSKAKAKKPKAGGPVVEALAPRKANGESQHLASLAPVPEEAALAPVEWADKHLEKLVPLAAKEKEWQLKFGNDAARDKVASELLAMRSISAKRETGINVAAVINLVPFQNPWAKEAKPKALPEDLTVDGEVVTEGGK